MKHQNLWSAAAFAGALFVLAVRMLAECGGYTHPESNAFLRVYNDRSRPVYEIVYDPLVTDWNAYQARELSYLVDCLDARFIYMCAARGMTHFYSLSTVLILLLCVVLQQYFLARDFRKVPPYLAALFSVAFVAAPCCGAPVFFRSAKPLVTLAATAVCFGAWRLFLHREQSSGTSGAWALFLGGVLAAPFADRQGAFLTSVVAGLCAAALTASAFDAVRARFGIGAEAVKKLRRAAFASGGGVLLSALYNLWIAPALIWRFNGYLPSFEFQNIGASGVWNLLSGSLYLFDNLGFFVLRVYGMTAILSGLALALGWGAFWFRAVRREFRMLPAALLTLAAAAAMLLCAALMTFRHHLMLRDDVIHTGYFMPMLAVVLFLAALTVESAANGKAAARIVGMLLGVSLAAGAVMPRFSHPSVRDHLIFYRQSAPAVIRAMNDDGFDLDGALLPYSSYKLVQHFRAYKTRR